MKEEPGKRNNGKVFKALGDFQAQGVNVLSSFISLFLFIIVFMMKKKSFDSERATKKAEVRVGYGCGSSCGGR